MSSEQRTCQNCAKPFVIDADDFAFYKRIAVPPPTFCPTCRLQRRLAHRNERTLYFRACDLCQKNTISRFAPDSPYTVYCPPCWYSDKWDPLEYGTDYDFTKPFFEQFRKLALRVPRISVIMVNAMNSEYGSQNRDVKDCYMAISTLKSEGIHYSYRVDKSRNCTDVSYVEEAEQCNELMYALKCFGVSNSVFAENSLDSALLYDCRNCRNSILCVNRRNGSYEIRNTAYSKEAYEEEKRHLNLGSYKNLIRAKEELHEKALQYPRKYAQIEHSVNVTGSRVYGSKNSFWCFDSNNIENCKYVLVGIEGLKDSYDVSYAGLGAELCYEGWSNQGSRLLFSIFSQPAHDTYYSDSCANSSFMFGSISCRNREYCILNQQYSKEEFETLKDKIISHMKEMPYTDARGLEYQYGEFFPAELSPYAYNESQAQDYFPLTENEAVAQKYRWRAMEKKTRATTLEWYNLPDHINDAPDAIVDEVISCSHKGECNDGCSYAFKIIPQELQLYRQAELPLPRMCPNCRHRERMKERFSLNLWQRQCDCAGVTSGNKKYANQASHLHNDAPCQESFQTPYSPELPAIVYCEHCYQTEVA